MKVTKICTRTPDYNRTVTALLTAFSPFGSLTEGVDGDALARTMFLWVIAAVDRERKGLADELLQRVLSWKTDQTATVELGSGEVCLRTPTSGTAIRLRRCCGAFLVEVDFGWKGSKSRAMEIMLAAEKAFIRFDAFRGCRRIDRATVLDAIRRQVKAALDG